MHLRLRSIAGVVYTEEPDPDKLPMPVSCFLSVFCIL